MAQYLDIGGATPDGSRKLNEVIGGEPPVYLCHDITSAQTNKAITFEGFIGYHFDIVIASIPQHVEPFKQLCEIHPSRPKLIYQIGNQWDVAASQAHNVMASARVDIPAGTHGIIYHQEFDTTLYRPSDKEPSRRICSYVNVFNKDNALYADDYDYFLKFEQLATGDYAVRAYGGQCRDGSLSGDVGVSSSIKDSMFTWHTKRGGDGYGHIIHNTFACGVPPIIKAEYYTGKLAEPLIKDGISAVCIDGLTPEQAYLKVVHYAKPENYAVLCNNARSIFLENVDFEYEADMIAAWLKNLV